MRHDHRDKKVANNEQCADAETVRETLLLLSLWLSKQAKTFHEEHVSYQRRGKKWERKACNINIRATA